MLPIRLLLETMIRIIGRILPNMKRYDGTSAQLSSIDYSIWAKAGNINSVSGIIYANHDGSEHPTGSTFNFSMERWNCIYYGEYTERSGKVYRALSTAGTNNDPALLSNADKWTLIADSVAEARKHVYVDTDYWDQFDIGSNYQHPITGRKCRKLLFKARRL